MSIDLNRRFFLFGATATVILPPKRTFFIPAKKIITVQEFWATHLGPWTDDDHRIFADISRLAGYRTRI